MGYSPVADDLWKEFLGPDKSTMYKNYEMKNCHCGLCGNTGVINTQRVVFTPAGLEVGVRRFCICPNGRAMLNANGGVQLSATSI